MSFSSARGGLRRGEVYRRQLASVSTMNSRARSPTAAPRALGSRMRDAAATLPEHSASFHDTNGSGDHHHHTATFHNTNGSGNHHRRATFQDTNGSGDQDRTATFQDTSGSGDDHRTVGVNTIVINRSDPYQLAITSHVRALYATSPPHCSFAEDKLTRTLDGCLHDAATSLPIVFSSTVWKCPICLGLPRQPVTISTCGHMYCDECVHQLIATNASADLLTHKCSVCRTQFKRGDLLHYGQWPLLLRQTWALSRVRCEGCDFESSPDDMVNHERTRCANRMVMCPGCWSTLPVEAMCEHAIHCDRVVVNCIHCGYAIRHTRHHLHDCEAVLACNHRQGICAPSTRGVVSQRSAVPVEELLWGSTGADQHLRNISPDRGVPTLAGVSAWSSSSSSSTSTIPSTQVRRYSTRRARRTIFDD